MGVQLFGADPERLALAARAVIDWVQPDFLDLNFGCPVNKVVCKNGGSALLKDPPLLARVAGAVVRAAGSVPVTAKIRTGWSAYSINATETSRCLEESGVQRIAVHGRTKEQGYSGRADWDVIAEVAAAVKIPVIGIGAGNATDGQVLVLHDMLGLSITGRVPKFVKNFMHGQDSIQSALKAYVSEVKATTFPGIEHGFSA